MMSLQIRILILLAAGWSFAIPVRAGDPPFYSAESAQWADSVLGQLTPDQRTAQLFMVAAWSNRDSTHTLEIDSLIRNYGVGGIIFFQGGPVRQALMTNHFQEGSRVPLLIGIDGEWGLAMRLDSTLRFPRQMTLSAISAPGYVYRMGSAIARQCRRLGIHTNFSPDADINNNPQNPVIGSRSFGDDAATVIRHATAYVQALQEQHILATGKHFPGHGDTDTDSHLALPVIRSDSARLDTLELSPFRALIRDGLGGMMVAHLFVPALDSSGLPTTLNPRVTTSLLRQQMGFKGLIFTDALNMKAVSATYPPGVVDKMALVAGNDVLLRAENVPRALEEINKAIAAGEITREDIDARVRKLLMVKFWCGLGSYQPVRLEHLVEDLNSPQDVLLQQELYEAALTLLSDPGRLLPLQRLDTLRIAAVAVSDTMGNPFQQQLQRYAPVDCFTLGSNLSPDSVRLLRSRLSGYNLVIVSLHNTTMNAVKGYGISDTLQGVMDSLFALRPCVLVNFGNAYTLSRIPSYDRLRAVVMAYEDMPVMQELAAQLVFGGLSASGRLPVTSNGHFKKGAGSVSPPAIRLKYTLPEAAALRSDILARIDSIALDAIARGAMPGCQVLVAKDSKVVYDKAFGTFSGDSAERVTPDDLYDIASVTKVAATAPALMKLYDEKDFDPDKPLSKYLSQLKKTDKKNLTGREVMAHQAGLMAWIPFWKKTVTATGPSGVIYRREPDRRFSVEVSDSLYMDKAYLDSVWQWIGQSRLGERGKYVYSDLGPLLLARAAEKISGEHLDDYLGKNFYRPLGVHRLQFHPMEQTPVTRIVPTENDTLFRHRLLRGTVHDPAAAMLGGVAGNAGLFSDANSLAILFQMYLNGGVYGGRRYLDSATVIRFSARAYPGGANRRGLLFDKPEPDPMKAGPTCAAASPRTFGHQGFTGTCVWADPAYHLVYVFLSNRICPDASNDKLVKLNVRTNIQQVVYDAMVK